MLKYQKWLAALTAFFALWWLLRAYVSASVGDTRVLQVVNVLPLYALVCFGAYSLGTIALSVMSVQDFPEASKELDQQVVEAKADLKRRGFNL
jgi:dolichyl-phosphate mannosyltransferase polypeptide 3